MNAQILICVRVKEKPYFTNGRVNEESDLVAYAALRAWGSKAKADRSRGEQWKQVCIELKDH